MTRVSVIAKTGVPNRKMMLVAYIDQMNSGRRHQVIPGARMRWMVTTKFKPVRIEENPPTKMARPASTTFVLLEAGPEGGSKGQPESTPPVKNAVIPKEP